MTVSVSRGLTKADEIAAPEIGKSRIGKRKRALADYGDNHIAAALDYRQAIIGIGITISPGKTKSAHIDAIAAHLEIGDEIIAQNY